MQRVDSVIPIGRMQKWNRTPKGVDLGSELIMRRIKYAACVDEPHRALSTID